MKNALRCLALVSLLMSPLAAFGRLNPPAGQPIPNDPARAAFVNDGLKAPMTIFPMRLVDRPNQDVSDALGMILENDGMMNLQPAEVSFQPDPGAPWEDMPTRLEEFMRSHPIATKYAIYAEIIGSPKNGVDELRWIIVDSEGKLVMSDRLLRNDRTLKRLLGRQPEPLTCCTAVAKRIFTLAKWQKGHAPKEGEGTYARLWAEKSGTPSEAERQAMNQRLVHLKEKLKDSRIVVLPTRVADRGDAGSASRLAHGMSEALGISVAALSEPVNLDIPGSSNEQRMLWDFARKLREHLRNHPIDADYILMADYLAEFAKGHVGAVHVVICDRTGDWVSVDFQNSHHPDFRRISPKSIEDCDKLATERIEKQLK